MRHPASNNDDKDGGGETGRDNTPCGKGKLEYEAGQKNFDEDVRRCLEETINPLQRVSRCFECSAKAETVLRG